MSKTVDERVVSMQFDNKHFESNAKTTLGTLEKLKQSLNFKGAADGLQNINAAANKVDMSGLSNGVEAVRVKFSGLQVFALTCLTRISNAAYDAGMKIAKSLTIDPVTTGFSEYELKMNSVQTIMASTGESLEVVNGYLEELNKYSDQTIYSFSDMTQNIGKFTNAGVKLEDAVLAMKGISNEAALSGANANEASRAMYNFAQALSVGYIQRIDWKSIELANMATVEFKEQLLNAAIQMGTVKKNAEGMYATIANPEKFYNAAAMFTETLDDQWLTTEVLIGTLKDYADETTEIGSRASKAATEVKTFTQLMDTLKESAQSGWAQTWEIIFGDFYEGKSLWTDISNSVGGFIDKMNDVRNTFLKSTLNSKWEKLNDKIAEAGLSTEEFGETLKEVAKDHGIDIDKLIKAHGSLKKVIEKGLIPVKTITEAFKKFINAEEEATETTKDLGDVVQRVLKGEFGNGEERIKRLTEAGYDYAAVQNKVNEILGVSKRHVSKLTDEQKENLKSLVKLSDEQLKNKGYTEDQIKALRELQEAAEETGTPIHELMEDMATPSGRDLLIETFSNIVKGLIKPLQLIGAAWKKVFPEFTAEKISDTIYNLIGKLHELSEAFVIDGEAAENFQKIFEGLFSLLQSSSWVIAGNLVSALKILKAVLGLFDISLADVLATFAEWITAFADWVKTYTPFMNMVDKIAAILKAVIEGLIECYDAFMSLTVVQDAIERISDALHKLFGRWVEIEGKITNNDIVKAIEKLFDNIANWIRSLEGSENLGKDIVQGLVNGILSGISSVASAVLELASAVITTFCEVLGIHSPSTVFFELAENIIAGLVNGLQNGASGIIDAIKTIAKSIVEAFNEIDFGALFVAGSVVGIGLLLKQLVNVFTEFLDKITKPLDGINLVLKGFAKIESSIGNMFNSIADRNKAKALETKSAAMWNFAKAIALLAAALIALTFVDTEKLKAAGWTLAALAGGLMAIMAIAGKLGGTFEFVALSALILGVSAGLLLLSLALKIIGDTDVNKGLATITVLSGLLAGIVFVFRFVGDNAKYIKDGGKALKKMAWAILLLVVAMKLISTMEWGDIGKGLATIAGIGAVFAGLILVFRWVGDNAKYIKDAGKSIKKMSTAILIVALAMKLIATMSWGDIAKGIVVIGGVGLLFAGFVKVSQFAGEHANDAGKMLKKMAWAIAILAIAIKLIASMSWAEIDKGIQTIAGIEILFLAFIGITKLIKDKDVNTAAASFTKMAGAILILSLAIKVFSTMSVEDIFKGIIAVGALELLFAGVMTLTKGGAGQNVSQAGNMLMKMSVAILILSGAIALLTLLDPVKIAVATGAIVGLVLSFAAAIAATKGSVDATGNIMKMAIAIGVMAASVAVLASLDPKRVGVAGLAMSAMIGTFALVVKATAVAQKAIGAVVTMTIVVAALAGILYLMSALKVESSISNAAALSVLLLAMSGALLILSRVGPMASMAYSGMIALGILIAGVAGVLVALAGLNKLFPGLEEFLDTGIVLLEKLGFALGSFFGNIVGGFAKGVTDGLPGIGKNLSSFMENASGFIEGAKGIDSGVMDGVKSLAGAILYLTGADLINKLTSIFKGDNSFALFAAQLKPFGQALVDFSSIVSGGIDEAAITAAANAGKLLAEMSKTLPGTGGVIEFFRGKKDLAVFGVQLAIFGEAIRSFSEAITRDGGIDAKAMEAAANAGKTMAELQASLPGTGGVVEFFTGKKDLVLFSSQLLAFGTAIKDFSNSVTGIDIKAVEAAATAGSIMAELQATLPGTGGVVQWFTGDKDLSIFGSQIVLFGQAIRDFSAIVSAEGAVNAAAIEAAVNAGTLMSTLQSSLVATGGVVDFFTGKQDLATFGENLKAFGNAIVNFSSTVSAEGAINQGAIEAAVNAGKLLTEVQKAIPEDKMFDGKISIDDFGRKISAFGSYMAAFSANVSNFNSEGASASISTAKSMADLIRSLNDITTDGVEAFKSAVTTMGTVSVKQFVDGFNFEIPNIVSLGANIINALVTGASQAQVNLTTAIDNLLRNILERAKECAKNFQTAGSDMAKALAEGVTVDGPKVSTAFSGALSNAVTSIKDKYWDFYGAGYYLVEGFAAGISANTWAAEAQAAAMATAAKQAAEEALGIASPSKVFYGIGRFSGLGFVNALTDFASKAYNAGAGMAESAKTGLSDTLSKINNIVNSDMDFNPTIRPVIDMSEIQNGANQINGLFSNRTYALAGINAQLDSAKIDRMGAVVSQLQQLNDSDNSDIVDAITTLRSDVNALGQAISNMQLTLDGGAVVGGLINRIDHSLGQIAGHKGRGN